MLASNTMLNKVKIPELSMLSSAAYLLGRVKKITSTVHRGTFSVRKRMGKGMLWAFAFDRPGPQSNDNRTLIRFDKIFSINFDMICI